MNTFISCDWGSSTMRLRLVDASTEKVLEEVTTNKGIAFCNNIFENTKAIATARQPFFLHILLDAIDQFSTIIGQNTIVIISGMASSSIGMVELPYQVFPFDGTAEELLIHRIRPEEHPELTILLVSGFRTHTDIMRGEESILLGCNLNGPGNKVVILPGTHSKHVFVENTTALDFKTYMTGEFFELLSQKSMLQKCIQTGLDDMAFEKGVLSAKKNSLLHQVFLVRARSLLNNENAVSNYQYLSGLLIGTELLALQKDYYSIYLLSTSTLQEPYVKAIEILKLSETVFCIDADVAIVSGHCKILLYYNDKI